MRDSDITIYSLYRGKMVQTGTTKDAQRNNFLIVCEFGDWSGFRTLMECIRQIPELEDNAKTANRPDGYYRIIERF